MSKNKVVLIGTGHVGLAYAYALINQSSLVRELVLIDLNEIKNHGEAMDLSDGTPFGPNTIDIKSGDYSDCSDADIICICAGANQAPGETRRDLILKNKRIFEGIVPRVMASGFDGIFLVATNPVDVMTYYTWKLSGLPQGRVIGSGTTLDTARLRYELGTATNISSKHVHAYVIGEHGDSEFVPWSLATIATQPIFDFVEEDLARKIEHNVRNAAYAIIKAKGHTCFGIGMCLVKITNAILGDKNAVLTVSTWHRHAEIFIGLPVLVNRDGVVKSIRLRLTNEEQTKLDNSIAVIKDMIVKSSP